MRSHELGLDRPGPFVTGKGLVVSARGSENVCRVMPDRRELVLIIADRRIVGDEPGQDRFRLGIVGQGFVGMPGRSLVNAQRKCFAGNTSCG